MENLTYQEISFKVSEVLNDKPKTLTEIVKDAGLEGYEPEVKEVLIFYGNTERLLYVKNREKKPLENLNKTVAYGPKGPIEVLQEN